MRAYPTAAIIGAGSSGIAGAKALHERGVPFTCFDWDLAAEHVAA